MNRLIHHGLVTPARIAFNLITGRSRPKCSFVNEWAIGIYSGPSPFHLAAPGQVRNPVLTAAHVTDVSAECVADPFMVREGDTWHMFFEVMNASNGRGEIGHATSLNGWEWTYQSIVLREPFHLSYPLVFKWDGEYFMVPESAANNRIALYRAKEFPRVWEYETTLIEGPFADHALFRHQDAWWLLAGADPKCHNQLQLFQADNLVGPWKEHPHSPIIKNDARIARPAGRTLLVGGELIRWTQDCAPTYGRTLNAFCISNLTKTSYSERPHASNPILAAGRESWAQHGMHHVDAHLIKEGEWLACVDGYNRKLRIELAY